MYIVQVKNPDRAGWKELPATKCRFRSLDNARSLHDHIISSPTYAGMEVRVWQTEADHRVEFDA